MAPPEYPCLIDEEHVVAELYGMTNVPSAAWIDEEGRMVRPVEVPGFGDDRRWMDRETFELPEEKSDRQRVIRQPYVDALRDWVPKGENSEYALSADEVRQKMRHTPTEDDTRAAAHVRLGRHLYHAGHIEAAKHHLQEAVRLSPQKWNYRRRSMALDPESPGQINLAPEFWEAFDALGDAAYYPAADMPGCRVSRPTGGTSTAKHQPSRGTPICSTFAALPNPELDKPSVSATRVPRHAVASAQR